MCMRVVFNLSRFFSFHLYSSYAINLLHMVENTSFSVIRYVYSRVSMLSLERLSVSF